MVGAKSEQSERLAAEEAAAGNAGRFELGVRCAVGRDESRVAKAEGPDKIMSSLQRHLQMRASPFEETLK